METANIFHFTKNRKSDFMIKKILLFPGYKGSITESQISGVERVLDSIGIEHERFSPNGNGEYDAIIALGGDGTMLKASKIAYTEDKPITSINFGTLGYMSGLENSELHILSSLKEGFETEERMLLDIRVIRNGAQIAETLALNEAVISRRTDGDIASLELMCDGTAVCAYRADGIIIATPTGSSAYAMSAGGPIIDTKLDAFCVCPICPHALGSRAMVFSPNSVLETYDRNRTDGNNLLLSDGKSICTLKFGDKVVVSRSEKTLKLIKLKKDAFYETLYKKMS